MKRVPVMMLPITNNYITIITKIACPTKMGGFGLELLVPIERTIVFLIRTSIPGCCEFFWPC